MLKWGLFSRLRNKLTFYFIIVTLASVGYGDIHPTTPATKVFVIFLIIFGVSTFVGVLANGTESTGGRREFVLADTALTPKLEELATELKSQYLLVYARTQTLIPPTKLDVSVRRPGLTVRAGTRADLP